MEGALPAGPFDFMDTLSRLLTDPRSLTAHELGTLLHMISAATSVRGPDAGSAGLTPAVAIAAVMDASVEMPDVQVEYAKIQAMQEIQRLVDAAHVGPGRGYTEWPRAPDRVFTPIDRVSQYRVHSERFRKKFSLYPDEFDVLFGRIHNELTRLPHRKLDLPNRLAQALRYMRTKKNQEEIGEWFGCGHSCSNDDIDAVVSVIVSVCVCVCVCVM